MREVLGAFRARGRLALVTLRRSPENLSWQLDRLGLTPYFDRVVSGPGGADGWRTKQTLIESLGREWGTPMVVGDTEADVLAGQALGLPTCAVAFGIRSEEYLGSLRPTHLVRSPEALLPLARAHHP
jgi:phosphoglycolate phosphatase-like HAD superfamily hydrolase